MALQITTGKQAKPVKAVIYGPEGVGKSSLAASFPRPLFIDVENGTSELDIARTQRPNSWIHFKQILGDIIKGSLGYQTLVIDTSDWLEKLATIQVCSSNGIKALGGNKDYGASFNELAGMWGDMLTCLECDLIDSGKMHVVFLAHSTTKKFELPEEQGQFDRYELAQEKKTGALLKQWADLLLFVNYKTIVVINDKAKTAKGHGGTKRVMYAQHCAAFDAKNRFDLPAEMPLDYQSIAQCFGGVTAQETYAEPQPEKPVSPAPAPANSEPAKPKPAKPADDTAHLVDTHQKLIALMNDSGVSYDDVLNVLVVRGKYPTGTPMKNIEPAFIEGYIFANWERIMQMIEDNRRVAA